MNRARARRIGLSVAASALLHGAVALLLWIRPGPPPRPPEPAPVTFDVVTVPRPRPIAPAAEAPAPRPAPRAGPVRRSIRTAPPVSPPAPDSRTPEVSPLVVSPVPGASDAPVSDAPRDVRLDAPPPSNWPTDPGSGGIAVAPPSRAEKRGRVPESQSVERMLGEAQARQRVQSGAVDTYFGELGRALLASWDAEAHVKDRGGLKWFGKQFVENGGAFMKIWADGAARYGESGVPLAGDTPEPILLERTRDDSGAAARIAYRKQVREQFKARKRATVRVVQRADGTLLSVELVSPSKDPDLDRAAIADIRAAAARIPRPPASGAGIKDPITSLWELELVISISPPVPTVEFEFDEVLGFVDARMPLDRRVYKRIRLVAVE